MFALIFLSPQVKRSVIISTKHGIYELPHELTNGLRNSYWLKVFILGYIINQKSRSLLAYSAYRGISHWCPTSPKQGTVLLSLVHYWIRIQG